MAKKELSITLRARNALMSGIAGARRTLMRFGGWVTGLGRRMACAFLGAGAGLAGFVALTARAYAKQERAEKSLASALASHGENVDALLPKLKAVAAAIQDQTGVGDEQTLQTMASLKLLGVHTDALEQAAKATIALKSAGVGEAQATKMVAQATAGNYTMLSRYLHALRTATSETEKAAVVNDFLSKGYKQQRDLLNTTSGAFAALRGHIGDVLEEFGKAINKSDALTGLLNRAGEAVKGFGEKVALFISSDRFREIQESVEGIIRAMASGGESRSSAMKAIGRVLVSAFEVAAQKAVSILKVSAGYIGNAIGSAARKAFWITDEEIAAESKRIQMEPVIARVNAVGAEQAQKDFEGLGWSAEEAAEAVKRALQTIRDEERGTLEATQGLVRALEELEAIGKSAFDELRIEDIPRPEITPEDFDLAGKGGGAGDAADRTAYSGYLQNMMSRIREMGHDVEEYGARSPFDSERNHERLAVAAEEGARLEKRTNELLEETRDLLKENLSQG